MEGIIAFLDYFGITRETIGAPLLVGVVISFFLWKFIVTPTRRELGAIKSEMTNLHHATKEVQLHLGRDGRFSPQHSLEQKPVFNEYGVHNSPMQPSEKGKRLLKNSGFNEVYPVLRDRVFELMDGMKLRTAYDYEAGASDALMTLSNDASMDQLKDYAVNNPDENLELIFGVASWVIRDDYATYRKSKKK